MMSSACRPATCAGEPSLTACGTRSQSFCFRSLLFVQSNVERAGRCVGPRAGATRGSARAASLSPHLDDDGGLGGAQLRHLLLQLLERACSARARANTHARARQSTSSREQLSGRPAAARRRRVRQQPAGRQAGVWRAARGVALRWCSPLLTSTSVTPTYGRITRPCSCSCRTISHTCGPTKQQQSRKQSRTHARTRALPTKSLQRFASAG